MQLRRICWRFLPGSIFTSTIGEASCIVKTIMRSVECSGLVHSVFVRADISPSSKVDWSGLTE